MRQRDKETRDVKPELVSFTDAPREAWIWGLKAGISPEKLHTAYGFRWIPYTSRVYIPVTGGAWIARAVDGRKPKYLASKNAKDQIWLGLADTNTTVVVEDVLSAIAIHEAGYRAIALLGTTFPLTTLAKAATTPTVVCWMDPDTAGQTAQKKLKRSLHLFDVTVKCVSSARDPKFHTRAEVRSMIEGAIL